MARWLFRLTILIGAAVLLLVALGFREARETVHVASYAVHAPGMRCAPRPFRVVVMGDLHLSSLTTRPAQIKRAVDKANALRPDLVVMVGDYFSQWWPNDDAGHLEGLAPLAGLRPRIGTFAILGNNDVTDGAEGISATLSRLGVKVLVNDAFVTPEVAVMGVAELTSNTANPVLVEERYATKLAIARIAPPPLTIWLAHNPVMIERVRSTGDMLFTGHTHGGQFLPGISVPVIDAAVRVGRALGFATGWPAERYVRGFYRAGDRRMIVTSGIGESVLPLRLGVPPEIMLVRFTGCDDAGSIR